MDNREEIELDLPDDELFALMKMAHERDITLNQFISQILQEQIDHLKEINKEQQ